MRKGNEVNSKRPTFTELGLLVGLLAHGFEVINGDPGILLLESPEGARIKTRFGRGGDFRHLSEIYVRHDYCSDFKGKVVFDVGMSNGDSSIFFALRGARVVIGLEPETESFKLALENIKANGLTGRIVPLKMALSDETGRSNLVTSSGSSNANTLTPEDAAQGTVRFDGFQEVETVTLEAIVRQYGVEHIDFLKMDCEGCEYTVIRSLSDNMLQVIKELCIEYHAGAAPLVRILESNGFRVESEGGAFGLLRARGGID